MFLVIINTNIVPNVLVLISDVPQMKGDTLKLKSDGLYVQQFEKGKKDIRIKLAGDLLVSS